MIASSQARFRTSALRSPRASSIRRHTPMPGTGRLWKQPLALWREIWRGLSRLLQCRLGWGAMGTCGQRGKHMQRIILAESGVPGRSRGRNIWDRDALVSQLQAARTFYFSSERVASQVLQGRGKGQFSSLFCQKICIFETSVQGFS